MKKIAAILAVVVLVGYIAICGALYHYQEKMIFPGQPLPANYQFQFENAFTEHFIPVDGAVLNALEFTPVDDTVELGVIVYFHGNGGSLDSWGNIADKFIHKHYKLLIVDYRGYGKSTGYICSQEQLLNDAQQVYEYSKKLLPALPTSKIIVWGRSIGTGMAAYVASINQVDALALETPYYSLHEVASAQMPWLPTSLILKYPIRTHEFLKTVKCPVYILHGTADEVIPYSSAQKLAKESSATFITVNGGGHTLNDFPEHEVFLDAVLR